MVCHGARIGTHGLAPNPEFFPFLSIVFAIYEVQLPPRLGLQSPQEESHWLKEEVVLWGGELQDKVIPALSWTL